jgi:ribosomal protein S18
MSAEAKEQVHLEIDQRMQELEDTGLTRQEILFERQEGIKLMDDPFFQYIKNQRAAREMLLKPGEEFTADRVIELALRQDIGPDPSLTSNRVNYKHLDPNDPSQLPFEYKKKYRDTTPVVKPQDYFADHNRMERRKTFFEYDQENPATFLNRPLTRNQLRKRFKRKISKKELDYNNTPMMTKFLTETGKLMNRYQTRLESPVHRRLSKIVKKMRH